jgi:3'(2'), 5'-bisphosphate nucleotidase
MTNTLEIMSSLARDAGDAILAIYGEDDFGVETKDDESPLTRADLAAHKILVEGLTAALPQIPVLSEESGGITWEQRRSWQTYFLVDPLDGTKEFISRNGEFTVNIALIENGVPIQGVVYVPVKDVLYAGDQKAGLATVTRDGSTETIRTRAVDVSQPLTLVASRRHGGDALQACLDVLNQHFDALDTTNMGSSLKLCLVAEGKADLYPRLAPTSEWDTAAAQAVVEAAGGRVVDVALETLRYNTKEDILNPFFYVLGDPDFRWLEILETVKIPGS